MAKTLRFICIIAFAFTVACERVASTKEPDGFEIVGHDVKSGRYTILERMHQSNGRYVVAKIVALCRSYQWGSRPAVNGPDQCDLPVGQMYRTNLMDSPRAEGQPDMSVNFTPGQDAILIQEGSGKDKTSNFLEVESIVVASETIGSAKT